MAYFKQSQGRIWHSPLLSDALRLQEFIFLLGDFTKYNEMYKRLSLQFSE